MTDRTRTPNAGAESRTGRRLRAMLLLSLAGFAIGFAFRPLVEEATNRNPGYLEARPPAPSAELAPQELATVELFQRASPSVVFVTSLEVRRDLAGRNVAEVPRGTGSGFVWDDQGHLVTNFHVIKDADVVHVSFADQSIWEARVVGVAPAKDLAVLQVDVPMGRLRPIAVGTASELRVGQAAYAIGNPFGLDHSLTTGVISAMGREIESQARIPIRDVIQTDAAINPGNSGGPLLDSGGRLIGVNTAIYSPSGAYAGIGFAIPVEVVSWVVPDLIRYGEVRRPSMGVQLATADVQRQLRVEGALVLAVVSGSGAEEAGIRPTTRDVRGQVILGDLIVEVDGTPVRSSTDLVLALERRSAGDRVAVVVSRDGDTRTVEVTLGPTR
jgi:protease Do-like 1, chloroplastic